MLYEYAGAYGLRPLEDQQIAGGLMLTAWGSSVPYAVNAVTFLASAALIARIPRGRLQSEEPLTRGHWRDVADGVRIPAAGTAAR